MINIGKLLDACGISYTDKQLSKLDNLLNKLLKKLSLHQLDSNETTPLNHITPPDTAHRCLTLFSPGYSSSENMHYPVLAHIQLI